jgi:signal transduction histidine kinase
MSLSAVMVLHNALFFIFVLVGFFHAFLMRPIPLAVLGVAVTSIILNTLPGGFKDPFGADFLAVLTIFLLQTVAISGGTISGIKVSEQSEQRRKMVAQLEAAMAENAGLHAQLVTQAREAGVHDERQRMAREIHDTLAQGLTGIVTQLQAAKRSKDDAAEWGRHIDTAAELARESLSEARRSVHAVGPEALESSRLGEAVSEVAGRWSEINSIPVEVTTTGDARPMHPEVEVALLRTTQEALANVTKHARASRVGLTLSYMEDLVRLDVRDDGVGFAPERGGTSNGKAPDGGFGLTAMRQRVSRLAGRLEIESEPGGGTAISASVPAIQPGGAA